MEKFQKLLHENDKCKKMHLEHVQSVDEISDPVPSTSTFGVLPGKCNDVEASTDFIENHPVNMDSKTNCEEKKSWAVRNKISHTALDDFLHTLKREGVNDLPLSAKTLFIVNKEITNI